MSESNIQLIFQTRRPQRKDISDLFVCLACDIQPQTPCKFASEHLMEWFSAPEKVVLAAMERAYDRDLIEYGVSLRSAWPTEKGKQLVVKFFNSIITETYRRAFELLNLEFRKGRSLE